MMKPDRVDACVGRFDFKHIWRMIFLLLLNNIKQRNTLTIYKQHNKKLQ